MVLGRRGVPAAGAWWSRTVAQRPNGPGWSATRWFWWGKTRAVETETRVAGAGLPSPARAQSMQVVRLPHFLSDQEIRSVAEEAARIRRDGAGAIRLASAGEPATESATSTPASWDPEGYESNRGDWQTTYLHTMHMFQNRLPELHAKLRDAAMLADAQHWGICAEAETASNGGKVSTRCIEIHTAGPSGGLPHPMHYDNGSCVTIDVMLTEPLAGGRFQTLELAGGGGGDDGCTQDVHEFRRGDAVIFPSHKYHSVTPVEQGVRQVLIMELWVGEERRCNHRCEQHYGLCTEPIGHWHAATASRVAW